MLVFVLDSTEDQSIYGSVIEHLSETDVDFSDNMDAALSRIPKRKYDVIVLSRAGGKTNIYDIAEEIKFTRTVGRSEVVLIEDNPTIASRVNGILRGRKVHNYKLSQLKDFSNLIGKVR